MCPHVADFGLAEYKKDLQHVSVENWRSSGKPTGGFHKKNMVGTLIYMAPEVLRKDVHTEKSDVYSFGISMNELLTGVVPYTDLRAETQAHTVLEMNYTEQQLTAAITSEGLRPALVSPESGAPASIVSLIQRCWDSNPQERPSFDDIVTELDPIMRYFKKVQEEVQVPVEPHIDNDPRTYQETVNWFSKGELLSKEALAANSCLRVCASSNDLLLYHPTLSSGSFATCGRRETMEDTHFLMHHMCNEKDIHLFGIFDGHRGAAAAEFSARALPGFFQTLVSTRSPSIALSEAFVKTDVAFRNELVSQRKLKGAIRKDLHPGCTAVTALIVKNKLFVANAGDCRTILCHGGNSVALSEDHVASRLEERDRVTKAGGQVKWQVDTWRVGSAALQVTRSIGDDDLKPFVTAEPEITETTLTSEDEYLLMFLRREMFILIVVVIQGKLEADIDKLMNLSCVVVGGQVMASDGLWDVMSNEEVVSIIRDTVKEPGMCSKRLATEAAERGSKDNITVIVVFLRPVSTAERIY
ncbi:hypothetical protein GIB67_021422 [Kingdonia uniflora]|uniref:Protein-serine/threonine phosphatase n=1 Tax=Kingdonia uniflora TaxID=39325 RepID=A0A7J7NCN1_9MAGN|nr:hypothetical protein GIB67_021422 [Kingdonia uniflora]